MMIQLVNDPPTTDANPTLFSVTGFPKTIEIRIGTIMEVQ